MARGYRPRLPDADSGRRGRRRASDAPLSADAPTSRPTGAILAHNAFIVIVDGGELTAPGPDGRPRIQTVASGQVLFRPAGAALPGAAVGGVARAVVVELKSS